MNTFKYCVSFVLGAGVGFLLGNYLVKSTYEKIANDEISEIKSHYKQKAITYVKDELTEDDKIEFSDKSLADCIMKKNEYYHDSFEKKEIKHKAYEISPDDFNDEEHEYSVASYTCYNDGVITDENDREIDTEELNNIFDFDVTNSFGNYEDDSVYARNDRLKIDYEILKDERNFSDI